VTFANLMIFISYVLMMTLALAGESLILVFAMTALFTALIAFIQSGLYHKWITKREGVIDDAGR
jgi:hypothetical protein